MRHPPRCARDENNEAAAGEGEMAAASCSRNMRKCVWPYTNREPNVNQAGDGQVYTADHLMPKWHTVTWQGMGWY